MNALALLLVRRFQGRKAHGAGIVCGALMGACIAEWTRAANLDRPYTLLLWLPAALLMTAIACGGKRALGRKTALLLCAMGLLGGIVQALYGATGSLALAYSAGVLSALGVAAAALRARRTAMLVQSVRVEIVHGGKAIALDGIVDSGNTLRDYASGRPVIVLPGLIHQAFADTLTHPVFAQTAGGRQMMDCFTPERVTVTLSGEACRVRASAAFCEGLEDGAPALVPPSLIDEVRE